MKKLSTMAVVFISTGGMIGSGWLFSPYYGFQTSRSRSNNFLVYHSFADIAYSIMFC